MADPDPDSGRKKKSDPDPGKKKPRSKTMGTKRVAKSKYCPNSE